MRTLPLCTDSRDLFEGTGVSVYARGLSAAQHALNPESTVLSSVGDATRWRRRASALWPGSQPARLDGPGRFVATDMFRRAQAGFDIRRQLTSIRLPGPTGIMHWSYPMPLRAVGWRNVYTIHDLIPLLHPDLTPISQTRHQRLIRAILAVADLIVTVSEASREEILHIFDYPADRVVNCGEAVARETSPADLPAGLRENGYLLVLGSVEPRKNIERIIAAHRNSGATVPLVIAGPSGWHSDTALPPIAQTSDIIRLPWLPHDVRLAVLMHARALLMPSLAEGFGLPVVEAMTHGVPVLCSSVGALAETAGGAALLVDPADGDAIANGIGRITFDDELRACLISAGYRNADRFTPAHFATTLAKTYTRIDSMEPGNRDGDPPKESA